MTNSKCIVHVISRGLWRPGWCQYSRASALHPPHGGLGCGLLLSPLLSPLLPLLPPLLPPLLRCLPLTWHLQRLQAALLLLAPL